MPDTVANETLGFLVHDVARGLRRCFEQHARAAALGLTRAQWAVLARLSRHQGISQVALAQILDIEPITLVPVLDRLQAAGLVSRRPDPRDRRANLLELTDAARPVLERIFQVGQDVFIEAQAGLSQQDVDRLMQLLVHVKGNLTASAEEDPVLAAVASRR